MSDAIDRALNALLDNDDLQRDLQTIMCLSVCSSLLTNFLGDQQMSSLADLIQAALMLAYNERQLG